LTFGFPMARTHDTVNHEIGAVVTPAGVYYRVWAPGQPKVDVIADRNGEGRRFPMLPESGGYWSVVDPDGRSGDRYWFKLGDGPLLPDPASRFQPEGVHGPSECINPNAFEWRCHGWRRPRWAGQTTYELHVGTFTPAGTYQGAIEKLDHLSRLGVEAIELMPLADFAGERNWGYDGVALFAPARSYGRPDDLRALVDAAHEHGLAVIVDLVYNHLGPQGNYLGSFSPYYFHADHETPWGRSFNLDGERNAPVRDYLLSNCAYWLDEFRVDGVRLDATHAIPDLSPRHLLQELTDVVHSRAAFVIIEDDRNSAALFRQPDGSGHGIDAGWADDFHHQVRVALTGTRESYFASYTGSAADLADTLAHGWSYRGQAYPQWADRPRGSGSDHLPARTFVFCIENHDQVGNRARGERLENLVSRQAFRAATLFLCLGPYPALLFMGQEWAASTPFLFFSDHGGDLGVKVTEGRRREFGHAPGPGSNPVPDPEASATFEASKLRWNELSEAPHAHALELYRSCLLERRSVLRPNSLHRRHWTVVGAGAFIAVRYLLEAGERMLLATFTAERLSARDLPESLRPNIGATWFVVLDSESTAFGGEMPPAGPDWTLYGPGALWLEAREKGADHAPQR